MKRLISLILCIVLLSSVLAGCNDPSTMDEYHKQFYQFIESCPEGQYTFESRDIQCVSAEFSLDMLLESVTDVIKATYVCTKQTESDYMHKFKMIESLRGNGVADTFYVYASPHTNPFYSTYKINYEVGTDYLLLLSRKSVLCLADDLLCAPIESFDSAVIPLNDAGKPILEKSIINGGAPLIDHIEDEALKSAFANGNFTNHILEKISDNPLVHNYGDSTESNDISTVISNSSYVVRISVDMLVQTSQFYRGEYKCKVKDLIKGNYALGAMYIFLPKYAITMGDEYIVAVENTILGDDNFELSAKCSIYPISELENIKAILNEIE